VRGQGNGFKDEGLMVKKFRDLWCKGLKNSSVSPLGIMVECDGSTGADSVTFNNAKQGKPACNGDDNVSPKRVDSSKVIMVNGGSLPKEDGSRVEKDVKNTGIRDKASAVGVVNDNVFPEVARSYVILLQGCDATPRPRNVHNDGHEAK
nr:paired amphipathic helix protein Sin3-like 2 isoform X1 [Tanacetum cinerariifolium]